MELKEKSPPEVTTARPPATSLGLRLTLVAVGLLLFGFLVYAILSIRISQGGLATKLEADLIKETDYTIFLIQNKLELANAVATHLAIAAEAGSLDENELDMILKNTLQKNAGIQGLAVGYEPDQFKAGVSSWAPYYGRNAENDEIQFTQLGDFDYFNQEWYLRSKSSLAPSISAPYRDPSRGGLWVVTAGVPFFNENGGLKGIASADLNISAVQETFIHLKFELTGYAFLLDRNGTIIGMGKENQPYEPMVDSMYTFANNTATDHWVELVDNMLAGKTGFQEALDWEGNPMYIAYAPVGMDTGWSLALVYPREEIVEKTRSLQTTLTGYSLLLAVVFGLVILYFSRTITDPLKKLTEAAEKISSGDLQVSVPVETDDEVGALSATINRMAVQLRETLSNLEMGIAERTTDLEIARRQSEHRAAQLLSIGEISKIINNEQELNILLPLTARLVSERFNFYHTGVFLIDETRQFAVLHAANSPGGQIMLNRGHKLKVGESGIVGYVARSGAPRIALDVGQDAVFFNNPDLPATRSEAALPLKIRDRVIGVLDVQSEKPGAFTAEDINILNILADQIAIAIENTRLLEQTKEALEEARAAYQQTLYEGWKSLGQEEEMVGYYQSLGGGRRLTRPMSTDEINQAMQRGEVLVFHADGKTGDPTLVVPIKLREQIIGVFHIKSPSSERQWTTDEINLAEAVSERLSLALENARLIQESQRQVIKEQTISEITGRIGSSVNLENVLLTAVEEIGKTIPGSEVTIRLKNENRNNGSK